MPAGVQRPDILLVDINGAQGGKTEKYFLSSTTNGVPDDNMIALAKDIVWGRTAFFGAEARVVYARISWAGGPPDRNIVPLPYPMGPHPAFNVGGGVGDTPGPINDDDAAVYTVAQVAGGMGANHYLNFIPDSWVTSQKLITGILPYFQGVGAVPPAGSFAAWSGTHLALCQAWWQLLKNSTYVGRKQTPTSYLLQTITDFIFRNVTDKKVGRFRGLHRGRRQKATIS